MINKEFFVDEPINPQYETIYEFQSQIVKEIFDRTVLA